MKILLTVETYLPEKNGMSEVVRQISENLVLLGHDITVATSYNSSRNCVSQISGVKIVEFKLSGNSVQGILGDPKDYIHFLMVLPHFLQSKLCHLASSMIHGEMHGGRWVVPSWMAVENGAIGFACTIFSIRQYRCGKHGA